MRVARFVTVALFALLLLGSCSGSGVERRRVLSTSAYVANTDPLEWRYGAMIEIDNRDTLSSRDITIFVRHQPHLHLDSVGISIYTSSPDSVIHLDRVTVPLDDSSKGRRGSSKINYQPYRTDVVWAQRGVYRMDIYPSIPVVGVEAVGVTVQQIER